MRLLVAVITLLAHGRHCHAAATCGSREGACTGGNPCSTASPFDFTPKDDPVTDTQCGTNWVYKPGSSGMECGGACGSSTTTLGNAEKLNCCVKQAICGNANEDGSGSTSAPMTCPTGKVYDPSKSASYCEGAKCTTTSSADVAACCLDTTYSPKTYVPTKHVKVLHGFFHYGGKDVFDPMDTDYQMAIVGFAALAVAVGLFLLLVMWMVNLCMCCKCCRKRCLCAHCCGTNKKKAQVKVIFFLVLAGVIAAGAYSPRGHFKAALVNTEGILDDMQNVFKTIQTNVEDINGQFTGTDGYSNLATLTKCCTPASTTAPGAPGCDGTMTTQLEGLFTTLGGTVNDMSSIVDGIPEKIESANDFLKNQVTKYIDMALGGVVAMMWLLIVFAIIAILTTCKSDDHIVLFFGSITLLVLVATVAGMVLTTVTLADFCHPGPSASLAPLFDEVLAPGSQTHAMATYYTTCEGTDPLGETKNLVTDKVQTLVDYLDGTKTITVGAYSLSYMDQKCYPGSCNGSPAKPNENCKDTDGEDDAARKSTGTGECNRCDNGAPASAVVKLGTKLKDEMLVNVKNIGDAVSCEVINKIYTDVVQDTICAPFLAGLAELWVVLAAAGFVILCVFIAFPCVTRIEEQGPGSDKALYGTDDGRTGVMVGGSSGVAHDLHSGQVRQATSAELSGSTIQYTSYSFQKPR